MYVSSTGGPERLGIVSNAIREWYNSPSCRTRRLVHHVRDTKLLLPHKTSKITLPVPTLLGPELGGTLYLAPCVSTIAVDFL